MTFYIAKPEIVKDEIGNSRQHCGEVTVVDEGVLESIPRALDEKLSVPHPVERCWSFGKGEMPNRSGERVQVTEEEAADALEWPWGRYPWRSAKDRGWPLPGSVKHPLPK